jgi:hypothetical protein
LPSEKCHLFDISSMQLTYVNHSSADADGEFKAIAASCLSQYHPPPQISFSPSSTGSGKVQPAFRTPSKFKKAPAPFPLFPQSTVVSLSSVNLLWTFLRLIKKQFISLLALSHLFESFHHSFFVVDIKRYVWMPTFLSRNPNNEIVPSSPLS